MGGGFGDALFVEVRVDPVVGAPPHAAELSHSMFLSKFSCNGLLATDYCQQNGTLR
jgi:hypothetical protein